MFYSFIYKCTESDLSFSEVSWKMVRRYLVLKESLHLTCMYLNSNVSTAEREYKILSLKSICFFPAGFGRHLVNAKACSSPSQ